MSIWKTVRDSPELTWMPQTHVNTTLQFKRSTRGFIMFFFWQKNVQSLACWVLRMWVQSSQQKTHTDRYRSSGKIILGPSRTGAYGCYCSLHAPAGPFPTWYAGYVLDPKFGLKYAPLFFSVVLWPTVCVLWFGLGLGRVYGGFIVFVIHNRFI